MKKHLLIAVLVLGLAGSLAGSMFYARRSAAYRAQIQSIQTELNRLQPMQPDVPVTSGPAMASMRAAPTDAAPAPSSGAEELQSRITYLEGIIAQRDSQIRELQSAPAQPAAPTHAAPARPSPQAWLDNLKKENPQQYEELIRRREEARKAAQNSFAEKAAFFLNRDQSNLTPDEQEQYAHMLEMLDQTWKIAEQTRADLPQDERRNLMRTVRHNMVELEPMLETERSREWYALGVRLGYDDKGAQDLALYLNEVIELTSMRDIYQNMRAGSFGDFHGMGHGTNAPTPR